MSFNAASHNASSLSSMSAEVKQLVQICQFESRYQSEVEQLVLPIQQIEYGVTITLEEQPDLVDIAGTFQNGNGNFWVALLDGKVIGCVGVVDIGNQQVALKKMFVHRDFRGKQFGVSASLMNMAKVWCQRCQVTAIFLGTTPQMTAAHRFYEKNGFVELEINQLPQEFPVVHVDKKFYCHKLGG